MDNDNKKVKELEIIDRICDIYAYYPVVNHACRMYDEVHEQKLVKSVTTGKNALKSSLAVSAGVAAAHLSGFDTSNPTFPIYCAMAFGVGVLLFNGMEEVKFDSNKAKKVTTNFKLVDRNFDVLQDRYFESITGYVEAFDCEGKWTSQLKDIILSNSDYIDQKQNEDVSFCDLSANSLLDFHNSLFDMDNMDYEVERHKLLLKEHQSLKTRKRLK